MSDAVETDLETQQLSFVFFDAKAEKMETEQNAFSPVMQPHKLQFPAVNLAAAAAKSANKLVFPPWYARFLLTLSFSRPNIFFLSLLLLRRIR